MSVEPLERDAGRTALSAVRIAFAESLSTRRFGPYTVVRPLITDSPAPLLLGLRTDREDRPKVLLKIYPQCPDASRIAARFRENPGLLEGLDEQGVVPLLDAGVLDDGLFYVALPYFEAQQPIEAYCNQRKLSTKSRVELFLRICDAVHNCHRHFILLRDFHPDSAFVTPEGVVKLPAISLGKLLEGTPAASAFAPVSAATSPEVLQGRAPTTASEVYSLGAMLYGLLTSHPPFEEDLLAEEELAKAILETEPPLASVAATMPIRGAAEAASNPAYLRMEGTRSEDLSHALQGEIDAILRVAMDKNPAKRYGSADQLAADLRRFLRGDAVSVYAGSRLRALKTFLLRDRTISAALAVVFGGLLAVTVMLGSYSLYAGRRARLAESKSADVRHIAHFLFRFDEGSLASMGPMQRMAIAPSLAALDRLADQGRSDTALLRELADVYARIGDFQSTIYVMDLKGAEESYGKALALSEFVATEEPFNTPQRADIARVNLKFGDLLFNNGSFAEAAGKYGNALDAFEKMAARERAARQGRRNILATLDKVGYARLQAGDLKLSTEAYERFMHFVRIWLTDEPDSMEAQAADALGTERAGYVLVKSGKTAAGEAGILKAAGMYRKLLLPDDPAPLLRRAAANCFTVLGDTQRDLGRKAEATENYRQARKLLERLWTDDQQSIQAQRDLSDIQVRLAALLSEVGQPQEAHALVTQSLRLLRPHAESSLSTQGEMLHFARLLLSGPVPELRDTAAALAIAQRAVDGAVVHDPRALEVLASAYAARGENSRAIETQLKAIAALPERLTSPLRKELEAGLERLRKPN